MHLFEEGSGQVYRQVEFLKRQCIKADLEIKRRRNGGGGCGGCKITKITDSGFHFKQGAGREKSAQQRYCGDLLVSNN